MEKVKEALLQRLFESLSDVPTGVHMSALLNHPTTKEKIDNIWPKLTAAELREIYETAPHNGRIRQTAADTTRERDFSYDDIMLLWGGTKPHTDGLYEFLGAKAVDRAGDLQKINTICGWAMETDDPLLMSAALGKLKIMDATREAWGKLIYISQVPEVIAVAEKKLNISAKTTS